MDLFEIYKKKYKCFVLGIDPAKNLKKIAKKKIILTLSLIILVIKYLRS